MNKNRNLNGVKQPLSDKSLEYLVSRAEEKFAHALFIPTAPVIEVVEVVVPVVSLHGTDDCRCDVCINKMLDGILQRSEEALNTLTENLDVQTA